MDPLAWGGTKGGKSPTGMGTGPGGICMGMGIDIGIDIDIGIGIIGCVGSRTIGRTGSIPTGLP